MRERKKGMRQEEIKKEIESLLKAKWTLYQILEKCQEYGKLEECEILRGQIESLTEQIEEYDLMIIGQ